MGGGARVRASLTLAKEEEAAAEAESETTPDVEAEAAPSGLRGKLVDELDHAPTIRQMLTPGWDRWSARDAIGELPGRLPAWVQYALITAGLVGMAILTIRGR